MVFRDKAMTTTIAGGNHPQDAHDLPERNACGHLRPYTEDRLRNASQTKSATRDRKASPKIRGSPPEAGKHPRLYRTCCRRNYRSRARKEMWLVWPRLQPRRRFGNPLARSPKSDTTAFPRILGRCEAVAAPKGVPKGQMERGAAFRENAIRAAAFPLPHGLSRRSRGRERTQMRR